MGALALIALPAVALFPGCGGGKADYGVGTFSSNVTLSAAQTALLVVNTGGGGANGFLNVNAPIASVASASKSTRAFGFTIAKGNYPFTGSFSPPARFSVAGTFPSSVRFTIVGQVPTNGGTGIYTITANGQTATGTLQVGTISATPTPTATTIVP